MKGFDLLLNRIKEQPTKATLRLRYLALVADLESVEEKITTVLKLAEFYRSGFPKEALEMAYLICRYDNTNIPAIEIIIEVMQLQGKETQAKLMSEYLSKIRRNLQVSSSNILKQIKYAAGDQTSDNQDEPSDNSGATSSSTWAASEETSNLLLAATDLEVDGIAKANQDHHLDSVGKSNQAREIPANHRPVFNDGAATIINQPSFLGSMQPRPTRDFSELDGLKTELVPLEVIEVKDSLSSRLSNEISEKTLPLKKSMSLDELRYDGFNRNIHIENLSTGPEAALSQGGSADEETHLVPMRNNLAELAQSGSIEKTEIISPSAKLQADKTILSEDEKSSRLKKKNGGGRDLNLEDYLGQSSDNIRSPDLLKSSKETKIFLEFGQKIADLNPLQETPDKVNEHTVVQSNGGLESIKKSEDVLVKIENKETDSAEKTTVFISNLSEHSDHSFPMEINPFDGKLPSKVNHQGSQNGEKIESIKLVIGRVSECPGAAQDHPGVAQDKTRLSKHLDQTDIAVVKPAGTRLDQDPITDNNHREQRIAASDSGSLHGDSLTLRPIPAHTEPRASGSSNFERFDESDSENVNSQTLASQTVAGESVAGESYAGGSVARLNLADKNLESSSSPEGVRPLSIENKLSENAQVILPESKGRDDISRSGNQQADPFAFSTDEIPQLSGNKIFATPSRGEVENTVILKLQDNSAMGGFDSEAQRGFNTIPEEREFRDSSSFAAEEKFGANKSPFGEDHQSLDLSKKLDELLAHKNYREALELLRNTAEKFSRSSWWKKGFDRIENSGLMSSNASSQTRTLQSHEVQALAYRLLEATKNLLAPHEYLREFFMKNTSETDREKIFDFFFYEPLPGMELLQIDVYMALGASLEAAQLVRDRLGENFRDVEGLVRRARMIWHSLGWQPFSWHPEEGAAKLLVILSERPRQRPSADLL